MYMQCRYNTQFFIEEKLQLSYIHTTFLSEISISKLSEQSGKRINIHPNWDISHTLQILSIRIVDVFLKSNHNSLSMCVISVHTQILWHRTFTQHIRRGSAQSSKNMAKNVQYKVITEIICFDLTRGQILIRSKMYFSISHFVTKYLHITIVYSLFFPN